ncbi:MAG: FAD-dependent oxidoreductase [Clostridia bacterium]|jgi:glycine/D-amino acid oxidase-like deaminating enzyme/nitrite reductase/ring-hydroxylating ferredoxin subunit|nr:FAD-dependent oxidoreductase [Clostridia bacterium]
MESIWMKNVDFKGRSALPGDLQAEAAVIGGGLAGVLTAYYLQQRNIRTIVLEAARTGGGQTKNTTAKITSQHNLLYARLLKNFGEEKAKQYAQANEGAIREYRRLITANKIDCSFEELPAYLYSPDQQDVPSLEEEARAAKKLGIHAEFVSQTSLPFPVAGAVRFDGQAQFHPLEFLQAIADELTIYEMTPVRTVEGSRIITDRGTVTAKHIVFAAHFPFINMPGFYFARMHQERSYVLALEGAAQPDGMYLGVDAEALSLRGFKNMLLLGGGGHRTGENKAGGKYAFLREKAAQFYPASKETAHWSAQDCMTLDGVPYIGKYAPSTDNWYVATGFGKWGMTSSMAAALLLSDSITGRENSFAEVFSPLRFTPAASMKAFLSNSGQAVKGLTRQTLLPVKADIENLPSGHGGVVEWGEEKIGLYKDEQGEAFAVSTRCPHLGCRLEWNPDEKSWDCPCHGSRFDYKGTLLDNPAQEDLETSAEA